MKWISVNNALPNFDIKVLIASGEDIIIGRLHSKTESASGLALDFYEGSSYDFWPYEATHWMPLPEPPKQ